MELKFKIKGQELIRIDKNPVASYTRNLLKCTFCFDEHWINLKKYAIFINVEDEKFVLPLGFGKKLSCLIPQDVMKTNYFRVSVFADELLTSTQETILLSPSGYDADIDDLDMDDIEEIKQNDFEDIEDKRRYYDDEVPRIPHCKQFIRDEHPWDD